MIGRLCPALCLLLIACGSSPSTRFYTLDPVPGKTVDAPHLKPDSVTVDAVHLPAILDRPEMVRRAPEGQLVVNERDHWGASLGEIARRVLAQNLASRLPRGTIVPEGTHVGPSGIGIVVDAQEFDVDAAGRAVLDADWRLIAGSPRKPVLVRHERIEQPAGSDAAAQAPAMSRALGTLADRIADALARYPHFNSGDDARQAGIRQQRGKSND